MPLALASSRTMPMSVSPVLVILVAANSADLVFSSTLAKTALEELDDAAEASLDVAGTVGVKLVLCIGLSIFMSALCGELVKPRALGLVASLLQ